MQPLADTTQIPHLFVHKLDHAHSLALVVSDWRAQDARGMEPTLRVKLPAIDMYCSSMSAACPFFYMMCGNIDTI
jgi:hypothetical protein